MLEKNSITIKYHTPFRLSILNFNFPEDKESKSSLLNDADPANAISL